MASFVRSILSGDSPFDRFVNGDRSDFGLAGKTRSTGSELSNQKHSSKSLAAYCAGWGTFHEK